MMEVGSMFLISSEVIYKVSKLLLNGFFQQIFEWCSSLHFKEI